MRKWRFTSSVDRRDSIGSLELVESDDYSPGGWKVLIRCGHVDGVGWYCVGLPGNFLDVVELEAAIQEAPGTLIPHPVPLMHKCFIHSVNNFAATDGGCLGLRA